MTQEESRKTAKEKAKLINAYADGLDLQRGNKSIVFEIWADFDPCEDDFDFTKYDYRIKPKAKYIPWTAATCPLKVCDIIKEKDSDFYTMISAIRKSSGEIWIGDATSAIKFNVLFDAFVMADGTPCGEKVE
jgi:hypothetical protein